VCLAESINKWVERMAARGSWRPLSGLICEIVNSVGQGNFTFVREKSGNFKHLWLWQPCYWSIYKMFVLFDLYMVYNCSWYAYQKLVLINYSELNNVDQYSYKTHERKDSFEANYRYYIKQGCPLGD